MIAQAPGFNASGAPANSTPPEKNLGGAASFDPPTWIKRIKAAERDRDAVMKPIWKYIDRRYTARNDCIDYHDGGVTLRQPRPPRVHSIVHALEGSLYFQDPKFFTRPRSTKYDKLARLMEPLMLSIWRDAVGEKELSWGIRATVKRGRAWFIVGYDTDYEQEARDRRAREQTASEDTNDVSSRFLDPADLASTAEPDEAPAEQPENPVEPGTYELDDRVCRRRISVRFLSNWDVVFDPAARCVEELWWIARRITAPIAMVQADETLVNTGDLQPDGMLRRRQGSETRGSHMGGKFQTPDKGVYGGALGGEDLTVELWELWYRVVDPETMAVTWDMAVISEQSPKVHRYEVAPYWFGNPFESLSWNDDGETLFTTSDIEQLLPIIVEEGDLREKMYRYLLRRCKDPTFLSKTLAGDQAKVRMIEVGGVGGFAVVADPPNGQPLQAHMATLPKNYDMGDHMAHLSVLDREIQADTGLGANQQAQAMKSDTSAFESQNVEMHSQARMADKERSVRGCCSRIMLKAAVAAAQFWDAQRVEENSSSAAAAQWRLMQFTPGDVQDGLHVFVEKGSMRPQSDVNRKQTYSEIMAVLKDPVLGRIFKADVAAQRWLDSSDIPEGSDVISEQGVKQLGMALQMAAAMQMAPPAAASGGPGQSQSNASAKAQGAA